MKKDDLRKLLKQRGLSTKGDKDEMINRLSVYVQDALANKGKSGNSDPNNDIINNTNNTNNDIINNTNNTNNDIINNTNNTNNDNTNNDNTNNDNTINDNTNNDNTINDNTSHSNFHVTPAIISTNYNTANSNDDGNVLKEVIMTSRDNDNEIITSNNTSNTFINNTNNITTTTNIDKKIDLERILREKLKAKTKLLKQARQTVRIDNLQGPFSLKELHDFLHDELSCNISDDNIMLNTMNTSISCILTFDNENDAVAIINIINNGSKTFPSSSSLYLTANLNKESKQETLKRITNYRPQLLYETKRRKCDMI